MKIMYIKSFSRYSSNSNLNYFKNDTIRFRINVVHTKELKAKKGLRQGDPIFPLIFFIAIDYLHWKLQHLEKVPNFNFHSKCKKLHIINLSFADDLMLFIRGDVISVELEMNTFNDLSKSTGLIVNLTKCKAYFGGMEDDIKETIKDLISFT